MVTHHALVKENFFLITEWFQGTGEKMYMEVKKWCRLIVAENQGRLLQYVTHYV